MNEIEDSFEDLINKILDLNISDIKKNKLIDRTYDILSKVTDIVDSQYRLHERLSRLENHIDYIDAKELDEMGIIKFPIEYICPYCNMTIEEEMDEDKDNMDVICPICKNEVHLQRSYDNE